MIIFVSNNSVIKINISFNFICSSKPLRRRQRDREEKVRRIKEGRAGREGRHIGQRAWFSQCWCVSSGSSWRWVPGGEDSSTVHRVPHSQPVESLLSSREEISYVLPLISCVLPLISRPSLLLLQLLQVEFLLVISVTEMDGRSALCIAAFKTFIFHNADKMLQASPRQGTVHFKT